MLKYIVKSDSKPAVVASISSKAFKIGIEIFEFDNKGEIQDEYELAGIL